MKKAYKIKVFLDTEVQVYFTRKKYNKFLRKYKQPEKRLEHMAGQAIWLDNETEGANLFAIGIFEDRASTCVHEATHTVENIMERYEITDSEFRAYTTGYISCELFNMCKKVFKKGK